MLFSQVKQLLIQTFFQPITKNLSSREWQTLSINGAQLWITILCSSLAWCLCLQTGFFTQIWLRLIMYKYVCMVRVYTDGTKEHLTWNLSGQGCKNIFNKNLTEMPDERPGEKAHTTLLHCNWCPYITLYEFISVLKTWYYTNAIYPNWWFSLFLSAASLTIIYFNNIRKC